jgi:hypothetical protein
MIEAGVPSTERVAVLSVRGVPAPPGVLIVAPAEVPRNVGRAQRKSRAKGRSIHKARPRAL